MMRTRIAPLFRAVLIITALVLGQVQVIFAVDDVSAAGSGLAGDGTAASVVSSDPEASVRRDGLDFECKIKVGAYLLASEFAGITPGATDYGLDVVPNTWDANPAQVNPSPAVSVDTGETMDWVFVIENNSGEAGCGGTGDEELYGINVTIIFADTSGNTIQTLSGNGVPFNWADPGNPGTLAGDGDIAWALVPLTVPPNVAGNLQISMAYASEAEFNPYAIGPDVEDGTAHEVGVTGPGFTLVSFAAEDEFGDPVTEAALGSSVNYRLAIANSRPSSTIQWLAVSSSEITSISSRIVSQCGSIDDWTMSDSDTVLNPGETAECLVTNVPVEGDPPPDTFIISATIEVSEAANGVSDNNYSALVKSTGVSVQLPSVKITKSVQYVRRGGEVIYEPGDTLEPVLPGDNITYLIVVTNDGDIELGNIFIIDTLTGPLYVTPGTTLAPGASLMRTTSHTVQAGGQDPLQNEVSVTADATNFSASVDAEAVASVDVSDSVLNIRLEALEPGTPPVVPWVGGVEIGNEVAFRVTARNLGTVMIENLQIQTVSLPLKTLGTPGAFSPDTVPPGEENSIYWNYIVSAADTDPMVNTVRVRGQLLDGTLVYGQASITLDITNPDIAISVQVLDPADADTVLRGQTVQYLVEVTNKNSEPICNVSVDQIKRNSTTGFEQTIIAGLPLPWTGTPGQILGDETLSTTTSYLVTGEDVDPLNMVFEVTAEDCGTAAPLSDRTARILDISDIQLNTQLSPSVSPALVGDPVDFVYQAINISSMALENVSATWCVYRSGVAVADHCNVLFDDGEAPSLPNDILGFDDVSDVFHYTITADDAAANPFLAEVTLTGTDNKGNTVSIKTARTLDIATPNLIFNLNGQTPAVFGDTITFGYTVGNQTEGALTNVRVYNLLVEDPGDTYGYEEVGYYSSILQDATVGGQFDYTIDSWDVINDGILNMRVRVIGTAPDSSTVLATANFEVEIIPMVEVIKSGDESSVAGTSVHYFVRIINHSRSQLLRITSYEDDVLAEYGVSVSHSDFSTWPTPEGEAGPIPGWLPPGESVSGSFLIPGYPEVPAAEGVHAYPSPLVNTFIVNGLRPNNETVSGIDTHVVDIACPIDFSINVVSLDDEPEFILGEYLEWQINFQNISSETISGMTIFEELEWGGEVPNSEILWPGPVGVLEPGQIAWITGQTNNEGRFAKLITSDYYTGGADGSEMTDTVRADFSAVGGASTCVETEEQPIFSPIRVYKFPSLGLAFTGETVEYTIIMENVSEANDAPYDTFYVTATDSLLQTGPIAFQYNGESGPWLTSGELSPNEVVTTTLSRTVLSSDPDELVNTVTAEFPDPTNAGVTLFTSAEALVYTGSPLELTKTPSTAEASPGAMISYDYTIRNISPYLITDISMVDDKIGNIIPDQTGGTIDLDPIDTLFGTSYFTWLDVPYEIPFDALNAVQNTATVEATVWTDSGPRTITTAVSAVVNLTASELELTKTVHYDDGTGLPGDEVSDMFGVSDGIPDVLSGTQVHYCFTVANNNLVVENWVNELLIQDRLFPNLQDSLTGAIDALPDHPERPDSRTLYGGEVVTFCEGPKTLVVTPELGDPLTNFASVSGTTRGATPVYNEDSVTVDIRGTDLLVTKLPSQTVAFVGDEVQYTITLFNNNASTDIRVNEVIDEFINGAPVTIDLADFDWSASKIAGSPPPVGELGADGGYATYTYSYVVQLDDPDPLENTVMASGWLKDAVDEADWTAVYDNTRAAMAVPESQLYVTKSVAPELSTASVEACLANPAACNTVTYTVTVTNLGTDTIHDVKVVDRHYDLWADDVIPVVFEGADLQDTELGPYQSTFISYELPMPTSAQIAANPDLDPYLNTATAYGVLLDNDGKPIPMPAENLDPDDPFDDAASLKGSAGAAVDIVQPNLRVRKTPVTLASTPGANATYTITITNTGETTLDAITFEDLMGSDPVVNLDTACPACGWVYGELPYKDYGSGTPEFNPVAGDPYEPSRGLEPQEQLIGTVSVVVPVEWTQTEFTNIIEVTAQTPDNTTLVDRSSATIDIRDDGILVEKLVGLTTVPMGAPVTYTIRVTNVGISPIVSLQISDQGMDSPESGSVLITDFPDGATNMLDPEEVFEYEYVHIIMPDDGDLYTNRVTVTATTESGGRVLNLAQATVDIETASVGIEKYVCVGADTDTVMPVPCLTTVNIGDDTTPDTVTYYIHIFNPGGLPLSYVEVTDSFGSIPGAQVPSTLDPNDGIPGGTDEAWITYQYDVEPGDPDPLENLAMVVGQTDTGVSVQDTAMAELSLVTGDLVLTKDGPDTALVGEEVTYNLTITNVSATDAITGISVIDPLDDTHGTSPIPDCTPPGDTLAAGASHSCTVTHTVTQADPSPLSNTATATGMQSGVPVSDSAMHSLEIATPGISVTKFADKQYAGINEDVTFTYRIENTGTAVINSLVVTESDVDAVFSQPWPTFLIPGQVAIRNWTRTMTPEDNDPYSNTITVTGVVSGNPIMAEATETVYLANDSLVVSNTPSVTYAQDGDPVSFTYTVTNLGPDPIVNLTLEDNLCFDTTPPATLPAQLNAGVSASFYCNTTAVAPGPLVSNVYVSGETSPGGVPLADTATAEVGVTTGGLLVTKNADRTTVGTVAPDNVIIYTIHVENVGDETLTGFIVDDPLVVGLAPAPPVTLSPGRSFTMSGTYTVEEPAPSSVVNTVTVTATGILTETEYSDSDTASVAVIEAGSTGELILTKSASRLAGRPGDMVTYTLMVQNITPDVMITNIDLIDPMLVYATPPIAGGAVDLPNLGPGNSWTRTYTVQIPASWIEPTFVNTAEVYADDGATLHDTASVTIDVEVLSLTKSADSPVLLGDVIEYTFEVTSYTTADVPLVTLDDPLIEVWTQALPSTIPSTGATATGTITVPDTFTGDTVENTATLYIDTDPVDEDSVIVTVLDAGLLIEILSVEQESGTEVLDVPQTGEPVTVNVQITNFGTVDIDDPGYTVTFDIAGSVCAPTETLPSVLPAPLVVDDPNAVIETSCEYTPPAGADEYFVDPFLVRTVTAVATGTVDAEAVESMPDETTVELYDPLLVVELELVPDSGLPGDDIVITMTVRNEGASSVGCGAAVPMPTNPTDPTCHLRFDDGSVDGPDAGTIPDGLLWTAFYDALANVDTTGDGLGDGVAFQNMVLSPFGTPDGSDELVFTALYTIEDTDVSETLTAMVSGGHYAPSISTLFEHYTVYDEASVDFVVELPEILVTLSVIPNPPIYGQTVNYSITVTNIGGVTVSNLLATYRISPYAAAVPNDGIMLVSGSASPVAQTIEGWIALGTTTLAPGQSTSGVLSKIEDQDGPYNFLVTVFGTGVVENVLVGSASDSIFADLYPNLSALGTPTPTVDPATLDPDAVDPQVTKTASVDSVQPGDAITWTITVRNGWTSTMSDVILQDNIPTSMTILGGSVDRGDIAIDGQYVTLTIDTMSPGEEATLTLDTVVGAGVASPSMITNTACAQHASSAQACDSISVSVGPDVSTLPSTGISSTPEQGAGLPLAGLLGVSVLAGMMVLMGLSLADRRTQIAVLVVGLVVIIIAAVVVMAVTGDDEKPSDIAQSGDTQGGGGADVVPSDGGSGDGVTMDFPPEPTPYIAPTPAGVRTLVIPKLADQFDVPVPIVDLPLEDRQWDVSGLGYYVGWLEGTTWMDNEWGNTVLAAHVQLGFQNPGPFWGLTELVPGDEILVVEGDIERRFEVQSITKVDPSDWTVTAPTTSPTLTLITCTEWDNNYGVFSQRLVVRAVPVVESPQG